MFRNYCKIAVRNLLKYKTFSVINISGLALGMAVALLIGLWIWDELSYDKNRKVMGASVFNLWRMLSKDFVILVGVSCCIALPFAWYFLQQWLNKFEYRTSISVGIFISVIAGTMFVALSTVSYQAVKTALANPVKSLRSE
jgi:hypothetical protein